MNEYRKEELTKRQLRDELHKLRERIEPVLKKVEENEDMVKEMYDFMFEEEGVEGRSVVDDLVLLRSMYNNVSGFSAIIGFVIGIFTIIVPVAVGLFKLYGLIIKWISG